MKTTDPRLVARYTRNIKRVYRLASHEETITGSLWYQTANLEARGIAQQYGIVSWYRVAAVIAVMSPNCSWETNLKNAHDLVRWYVQGIEPDIGYATYPANVHKALAIIRGEPIGEHVNGPKVTAFYRAIVTAGWSREPVIDRHAYALAVGSRKRPIRKPTLRDATTAYCIASKELNVAVSTLQAITWLVWRRKVNIPHAERRKRARTAGGIA